MSAVAIGGYTPVEVDLWGHPYETVAATRAVSEKARPLVDKLQTVESPDTLVETMAAIIDLRVRPVEGTRKASTLIKAKWRDDEVTVDAVTQLMKDLREADRPI